MSIQRIKSKWAKTKVLLKSENLRPYIPETKLFNRKNLLSMLEEFGMIYVKPVNGTFGSGVIRVEKVISPVISYNYQLGVTKHAFPTFELLYQSILTKKKGRPYIIQKGIQLLKHKKRKFDIRVMVQKNPRNEWEATGIIGRLGHPAKIVTNYHSGGTPMAIERLMADHTTPMELRAFKNRLNTLSIAIAKSLQKTYPNIKEIGVDVAIDKQLHPWILEVNTSPDPFIFRKLADKKVFRRIYQYAIAYGRYKKRSSLP